MQPRDITLVLIGTVLTAWLAAIVVRRKLHREFPCFFAYLILSVIVPLIRLSVSGNYVTFFIVFWATEALYAVLTLLVLYEVFRKVFSAFYKLWHFPLVFGGTVGIAASVQIWLAIMKPPIQAVPMLGVILSFAAAVNWVETILFCLFFASTLLLGIHWRSYSFGIVTGFGFPALAGLLAFTLRSEFGTKYTTLVKYASPMAYLLGLLVWLGTFIHQPSACLVRPERDRGVSGESPRINKRTAIVI
ncbi:MAG TPA: hypothetical protein VKV30_04795 [Candidatus Angelobacter sp.]|nr:hypothetical protein [Candidatus Angelobacter sp.]